MRINIAGVEVDRVTVAQTIQSLKNFVRTGRPHYVVTTYSEFIVEAQHNAKFHGVLNNADLSVADGIGIIWAAKFLSLPNKGKLETIFQWVGTLFGIILMPKQIRSVLPEQVTGSRLIWDIAKLAEENNFTLALVGGWYGVAEKSAVALQRKYPNLKINLAYEPQAFNQETVARIQASNSDILLIAYQPPKQEIWIAENLPNLNVRVALGLGGTFDYLAGLRMPAPSLVHYLGLEWLWRLITQPWRMKRMWNAIVVFSFIILKFKLKKK